jgi:hypothetical protein
MTDADEIEALDSEINASGSLPKLTPRATKNAA